MQRICLYILPLFLLSASCNKQKTAEDTPSVEITKKNYINLSLDVTSANQMEVSESNQIVHLKTTGGDPYLFTSPLAKNAKKNKVLTFEYKLTAELEQLQVFLGAPITEERSLKIGPVPKSDTWHPFRIDLGEQMETYSWGSESNFLRLDFGSKSGVSIDIRKLRLTERNEQEKLSAQKRKEFRQKDQDFEKSIIDYLQKEFSSKITEVRIDENYVHIKGLVKGLGKAQLFEITPYEDVTNLNDTEMIKSLEEGSFSIQLNRYVEKDGFHYDRLLSKWAIGKTIDKEEAPVSLQSHAHFPDIISSKYNLPIAQLENKKGLGGLRNNSLMIGDLDKLDIGSVTVNIPITSYVYTYNRVNSIAHNYGGKTYYFDKEKVENLDKVLLAASQRNIVVAAIILIQKAADCVDPVIGQLMQSAHFTSGAFFTMPRLDNAKGVNCYAAMIDFLASRYCTPGNVHGRIHKWIMHNEVDAGSTWTNMGNDRPLYVYLNAYYKSMRICYAITRSYDNNAEVLASFTHSWDDPVPEGDYAVLGMLGGLKKYSLREGDFQWGLAYHSYPQDLNEPKTWNDTKASFRMNSPLVTFKNLEVIDAWIKMPENKYKSKIKRTLWLSENGTNSRTYSQKDLLEQAAGFAYAWKKIEQLDGIDAIQWHNWMDNRFEFGLKIGLRRFSDDANDPGGEKLIWYAFQAAGTGNEDEVFEPYKAIIGIDNWGEILKSVQ